MKLISHRGNVDSRRPDMENQPSYIDQAIASGYDVEVDIWHTPTGWCLGHDGPELTISQMWLHDRADKLWLHCKNFLALQKLLNSGLKCLLPRTGKAHRYRKRRRYLVAQP
jgi:hypothetical protein